MVTIIINLIKKLFYFLCDLIAFYEITEMRRRYVYKIIYHIPLFFCFAVFYPLKKSSAGVGVGSKQVLLILEYFMENFEQYNRYGFFGSGFHLSFCPDVILRVV